MAVTGRAPVMGRLRVWGTEARRGGRSSALCLRIPGQTPGMRRDRSTLTTERGDTHRRWIMADTRYVEQTLHDLERALNDLVHLDLLPGEAARAVMEIATIRMK